MIKRFLHKLIKHSPDQIEIHSLSPDGVPSSADAQGLVVYSDAGIQCRMRITSAGFPHRSSLILRREKNMYPLMVNQLMGRGKGIFEDETGNLTVEMLERVFYSKDALLLPAAAFLAGRCQPDTPEVQGHLTALLHGLLNSLPADALDVMTPAYIEAAMSLALCGEPETARQALLPLVNVDVPDDMESYLAAFYLAQLGDPSGWPAMLRCLHNQSDEHTRLMASRHLPAFKPYDGMSIHGQIVDVRAELVQRLHDSHAYVRVEIPSLLAAVDVQGLSELLISVVEQDDDPGVRQAARDMLEYLSNGESI
ncbi:MAG: HEAT repeat domain-containing protein [Anaerolineae bacterium]|nr:HEAT repeat domain-containing protein [Anaerolineae bacterium]